MMMSTIGRMPLSMLSDDACRKACLSLKRTAHN